jgi:hypothetical protein
MARVVLALTIAALVAPATGAAKGYPLVFDRASAKPGDVVVAMVPGTPANYVPEYTEPGFRVYLVAVRDVDRVRHFLPVDPRYVDVGNLRGSFGYRGLVRFKVPKLRPGLYTTAIRIRGAFYVTHPAAKEQYGVRGRLTLRIRSR